MDETVKYHMEWMKRLTDRGRIHLGGLERCTGGLITHLEEIIRKKSAGKAREVWDSMAQYSHVLRACREQGAGFMLVGLESRMERIESLAKRHRHAEHKPADAAEEKAGLVSVALPGANWSLKQPLIGRLKVIPAGKDIRRLLSSRAGDTDCVIYLLESTRATIVELIEWPDKNSYVVSSSGGANSEEMNFARSEGRIYVNGAAPYFESLKRLDGRQVILRPADVTPAAPPRVAPVNVESTLSVGDDSLSPTAYINRVVTNSTNREITYAFLAWSLEGSEAGRAACEELKRLLTNEQYRRRVEEGRDIPPKDYPRGYKLRTTSEFVRALARFASAREKRRYRYALKVAEAFPYAPLSRLLKEVLVEDKSKPRRWLFFGRK